MTSLVFLFQDLDNRANDGKPLKVRLTNGAEYEVDVIVSAIGVVPNTAWLDGALQLDPQNQGIVVGR